MPAGMKKWTCNLPYVSQDDQPFHKVVGENAGVDVDAGVGVDECDEILDPYPKNSSYLDYFQS